MKQKLRVRQLQTAEDQLSATVNAILPCGDLVIILYQFFLRVIAVKRLSLRLRQLRTAEAQLSAADKERTELRTVVEMKQGEWLDKARAQVEERVKESMRKVRAIALYFLAFVRK